MMPSQKVINGDKLEAAYPAQPLMTQLTSHGSLNQSWEAHVEHLSTAQAIHAQQAVRTSCRETAF